jgi:hypothetical protein
MVNVVFVSCAADATAPIAQDNSEILAQLASISSRIDSIDQRTRRIDEATIIAVDSIVTRLSDPEANFLASLVDAIELSAEVKAEVCAELAGMVGGEYSVGPNAEGGAHAEAGPSVIEAEAQAKVQARLETEAKLKFGLEGQLKGSICAALGAELGTDLETAAAAMRGALADLGIDASTMTNLVDRVSNPTSASYESTISAVRSAVPLPSAITSLVDNPVSIITNSPAITTFATQARCNPSFYVGGSPFQDAQSRLCSLVVPSAAEYIGIISALAGVPSNVATLKTSLFSTCSRVNSLIPQTLNIPSWSVTILSSTYTVFPGYNARLFPGLATLTC